MTRIRVYTKDGRGLLAEFRFAHFLSDAGRQMIERYARRFGSGAYYLETFPVELEARYP